MQDEESGGYCGVERDGGDGFHGRAARIQSGERRLRGGLTAEVRLLAVPIARGADLIVYDWGCCIKKAKANKSIFPPRPGEPRNIGFEDWRCGKVFNRSAAGEGE